MPCITYSVIALWHFDKCKQLCTPYVTGYPSSTSTYKDCESGTSSSNLSDHSDVSDDYIVYSS